MSANYTNNVFLSSTPIDATVGSLIVTNLSINEPIKTNGQKQLISSKLEISDVVDLQSSLDTKTQLDFIEGVTPGVPPSNQVRLYSKADKNLYFQNDAGLELKLSSGGGGGSTWQFSVLTAGNPVSGEFRYDSTTPTLVEELVINQENSSGSSQRPMFLTLLEGDQIYFCDAGETNCKLFTLTGDVVDNTTFFTIPVTLENQNNVSNFIDAEQINIQFFPQSNTLQTTYNVSSQPQITTSVANGSLQIQNGDALDTDEVLEIKNIAGSSTFSVDGNGDAIMNNLRTTDLEVHIGALAGVTTQGASAVAIGDLAGNNNQDDFCVAIGFEAGKTNQSLGSVAIGQSAGVTTQGTSAVAIGHRSGTTTQGLVSVAIGNFAGNNNQAGLSVAIGSSAGTTNQKTRSVAIGILAGNDTQGESSVAVGDFAGKTDQKDSAVAIGDGAGENTQGLKSVAIGFEAGDTTQNDLSVAIGNIAGKTSQGSGSVAIGSQTGSTTQASNCVAIGSQAGNANQKANSVAIGVNAGANTQDTGSVAIGRAAASTTQGISSIAIGDGAGTTNQDTFSVAIGFSAGEDNQGTKSIAIGFEAGDITQADFSIALGNGAGITNQGESSIAIGTSAANLNQSSVAIAIGQGAGGNTQKSGAIAIGHLSGATTQAAGSISIGQGAATTNQKTNSVAIGLTAGNLNQGESCVAIGEQAGETTQGDFAIAIGDSAGKTTQGIEAIAIGRNTIAQGADSIAIGTTASDGGFADSIAIGSLAVCTKANQMILGSSFIDEVSNLSDNLCDLGNGSRRWKDIYGGTKVITPSIQESTLASQVNLTPTEIDLVATTVKINGTPITSGGTLQGAYDASTPPLITTTAAKGDVAFKRGSTLDTDDVVTVQNGAGTQVLSITGTGALTSADDILFDQGSGVDVSFKLNDGNPSLTFSKDDGGNFTRAFMENIGDAVEADRHFDIGYNTGAMGTGVVIGFAIGNDGFVTVLGDMILGDNIFPSGVGTHDIGSPTQIFDNIFVNKSYGSIFFVDNSTDTINPGLDTYEAVAGVATASLSNDFTSVLTSPSSLTYTGLPTKIFKVDIAFSWATTSGSSDDRCKAIVEVEGVTVSASEIQSQLRDEGNQNYPRNASISFITSLATNDTLQMFVKNVDNGGRDILVISYNMSVFEI